MTTPARPNVRPANPCFSSGPCAKRPGWSLAALAGRLARPLAPLEAGQGEAAGGDRPLARAPRPARRLAPRHRAGVGHRRHRDGDVVAARRARRRRARLGELRRAVGHRRRQAAEARRRARARGRLRPAARPRRRSTARATSSSPGTAPPPASSCRTATGSPPTARG